MSVCWSLRTNDVIRRANDTKYGAAAGVFRTENLSRAHRVIHQMQAAGICWVNTWGDSPAEMPVGGYKLSGVGRENGPELSTIRRLRAFLLNLATTLRAPYTLTRNTQFYGLA